MLSAEQVELITREVVGQLQGKFNNLNAVNHSGPLNQAAKLIPVAVSVRHLHIAQSELDILYGKGYQLTKKKDLYQPGEFSAEETVTLVGANLKPIAGVRILGPVRPITQVEISRTDAIFLGVPAAVSLSGNLSSAAPIALVGPMGSITLQNGAIIANRHIHINTVDADKWGLKDNDEISVRTMQSERPTVFQSVQVRVDPSYKLIMHIDTDDANAAGIKCGGHVEIV